jgi:hypothetical protein
MISETVAVRGVSSLFSREQRDIRVCERYLRLKSSGGLCVVPGYLSIMSDVWGSLERVSTTLSKGALSLFAFHHQSRLMRLLHCWTALGKRFGKLGRVHPSPASGYWVASLRQMFLLRFFQFTGRVLEKAEIGMMQYFDVVLSGAIFFSPSVRT